MSLEQEPWKAPSRYGICHECQKRADEFVYLQYKYLRKVDQPWRGKHKVAMHWSSCAPLYLTGYDRHGTGYIIERLWQKQ